MFERFTDPARRVVVYAQEEATTLNYNYIGTEHILLGLIREGEGVAAKALELLGISLDGARRQVTEIIGEGQQAPAGHIPFTPRAKKVLELSLREALQLGHNHIDTEHILLGIIREGEGVAARALTAMGADLARVRQQVIQLLPAYPAQEPVTTSGMFDQLTDRARRVVQLAQEEARMLGHDYIGTEHILLGLIREGEGIAAKALDSLGISHHGARQKIIQIIGQGEHAPIKNIRFMPCVEKVLVLSGGEALQLGHNDIGTEHILLGLIREGGGVAAQVLTKMGTDLEKVRQRVIQLLSAYQDANTELKELDEQIAEIRREKDAAIETQDFEKAVRLWDKERQLTARRAGVVRVWKSRG